MIEMIEHITAQEARELSDKYYQAWLEEQTKLYGITLLDVYKRIEDAAKQHKYSCSFNIPNDNERTFIITILNINGYRVKEMTYSSFFVDWGK